MELVDVTAAVVGTVVVGFDVLVVATVMDVLVGDSSAADSESLAHAARINESARMSIDTRFIRY